ncbi:MAG: alpha/beta fold hydrolase [Bacteroidia bacterium]|nr:alpha/beta fold hydrolase [Bacteroidia bacterium]
MPVIDESSFRPPRAILNRHLHTVWANLFRKVEGVNYRRERIDTPDGDFLDLDWCDNDSRTLLIISHGLEGSSKRPYVLGMARTALDMGWDALAWNFRSCSGELNRTRVFYHGGVTWDLDWVIQHALQTQKYDRIFLLGFSLGGNVTLKYLGERGSSLPAQIQRAAVISAPVWLEDSLSSLEKGPNRVYEQIFLRDYKKKLREKAALMPGEFDLTGLESITTMREFDNRYVAPVHGFRDGNHLYTETSSRRLIPEIKLPTLIINAKDDPFLGPECYPVEEAQANENVYLEMPDMGGHVGFLSPDGYWTERRVAEWLAPDWFDYPHSLGLG